MLKVDNVLGFLGARVDDLGTASDQKGVLFYLTVLLEIPKSSGG